MALTDIPRFKSIGIIPSMQPTHATSDKNMAEQRIGPERILTRRTPDIRKKR